MGELRLPHRERIMGFGLLFIGYFLEFMLGMSEIGTFTHIIGYMVMFAGLARLRRYCRLFTYAQYATLSLMPVAVYQTLKELPQFFDVSFSFVNEPVSLVFWWLCIILEVLFHVLLLLAVAEICKRTGVRKNVARAIQNIVIVTIYGVVYLLPIEFLYGVQLLFQLIYVICNLVLIASCYMRICPAGEENMDRPVKLSHIAWIARLQQKYQKSEDKAINADRAYHQQRYDEQVQRLNLTRKGNKQPSHSRAAKRAEVEAAREAARRRRDQDL
jgi:hypothetical protein